ncbi:MAG TPA: thioesterase [Actinobacteria bacterium]|nr:thioesterase [Actinomycetota bacterium]
MPEIGAAATHTHVVTEADTALALGSGDVPVLGTPKVVALVERASILAVGDLPDGETTLGTSIDVRHVAPAPVGAEVVATAELVGIEGRSLRFRVTLAWGERLLASGTHTRVLVDRDRFLARVR